jgi:hypothetical protein
METGNLECWKQFVGERVKIIITDDFHPKKKEGVLKDISATHLFLDLGSRVDIILLSLILRVEVLK